MAPTRVTPRAAKGLLLGLVLVALAACSSSAGSGPAAGSGQESESPQPSVAVTSTEPPTEPSDLPNGTYRLELTADKVAELGGPPSDIGTLTLTVKDGTYQLDCRPIARPGVDCGAGDPSMGTIVELGYLRGTGDTVWFVHDQARLAEKKGCIRNSDSAQGCGPEGGYRMSWKLEGDQLVWSEYVGLGDEAGPSPSWWTVPWQRIS